jgi:membrane protease YdiL (CAAX protease family)
MNIKSILRRFPIASYFLLAYFISWGGAFALGGPKYLRGESMGLDDALLMTPFVLGGPLIAGLVMTYIIDGNDGLRELRNRLLRWRVGLRWYVLALLTFPVFILLVLLPLAAIVSPDFAPSLIGYGILAGLFAGFLEEIGWMGFAFPRMEARFGTWRATIYLALLHGLWHALPGFLGEFGAFGALWLPRFIVMWIVAMAAMRVLLVWIYKNTNSLLFAQLTHASSTGFLVILGPENLRPVQETLWWSIYALALWIPVLIILFMNGPGLVHRREPAVIP